MKPLLPAADAATLPVPATTLAEASRALWLATLSLMTAFMQMQAPAHRYLLARRIARNLQTLGEQDCFSEDSRRRFRMLQGRWRDKAERLSPHPQPQAQPSWWHALLRNLRGLR